MKGHERKTARSKKTLKLPALVRDITSILCHLDTHRWHSTCILMQVFHSFHINVSNFSVADNIAFRRRFTE